MTTQPNEELNKILTDLAQDVTPTVPETVPPSNMTMPVSKRSTKQVEVIPGIMVSQNLIDEAVRLTSDPADSSMDYAERVRIASAERVKRANAELREDITTSRQVVLAMVQRMRDPMKYDEKFVSYDNMPAPLQRVVKAYIEADAANRELNEAVAALGKDLQPPVAKSE